jgi:cyclin D1/2/4
VTGKKDVDQFNRVKISYNMSVSADVSTPSVNLYCNETAGDALCSNNADGISEINSAYFPVDIDESYIDNILVSELHQMPETELIARFPDIPESGSAHQDTLNWMLKVDASVLILLPLVFFSFFLAK